MGAGAWQGQEGILLGQQWSQVDTPSVLYASGIVPFVIPTTNNSLDSWNVGRVLHDGQAHKSAAVL